MVTFKFSCPQNGTLTVKGNQIDWSLNLNKCWEITEDRVLRRTGLRQSPQGLSEQRRTGRWEIKERGSGGWRAVTRVDVLSARWTEDFRKTTTV